MAALMLPDRLDLSQVAQLARQITAYQAEDLTLDASEVTHLGALGVQLLLVTRNHWAQSGKSLTVTPRSEEFDAALICFGLTGADLPGAERGTT